MEEIGGSQSKIEYDNMFDSNTFSELDDFYIVQAINVSGRELVLTFLSMEEVPIHLEDDKENVEHAIWQFKQYAAMLHQATRISSESTNEEDNKVLIYDEVDDFAGAGDEISGEGAAGFSGEKAECDEDEGNLDDVELRANKAEVDDDVQLNSTRNNFKFSIKKFLSHRSLSVRDSTKTKFNNISDARRKKINDHLRDFVFAEEQYLNDMKKVMKDYIPYLNTANNGESLNIFTNIPTICEQTEIFIENIKASLDDIENVARIFIKYEALFRLYSQYALEKLSADLELSKYSHIIEVRQAELGDVLNLNAYLSEPTERLSEYILLLQRIKANVKADPMISNYFAFAINTIANIKATGDILASIRSVPSSLVVEGTFRKSDDFNITYPKKIKAKIFLFDDIIIITEILPKQRNIFNYVESIRMCDLHIVPLEKKSVCFHLVDYKRNKETGSDRYTYKLEAKSAQIKNSWTTSIELNLWDQFQAKKSSMAARTNTGQLTRNNAQINCELVHITRVVIEGIEDNGQANSTSHQLTRLHKNKKSFYPIMWEVVTFYMIIWKTKFKMDGPKKCCTQDIWNVYLSNFEAFKICCAI